MTEIGNIIPHFEVTDTMLISKTTKKGPRKKSLHPKINSVMPIFDFVLVYSCRFLPKTMSDFISAMYIASDISVIFSMRFLSFRAFAIVTIPVSPIGIWLLTGRRLMPSLIEGIFSLIILQRYNLYFIWFKRVR